MATIKSYTDIEQSKVLAKILSPESADMWYEDSGLMIPRLGHIPKEHTNTEAPCWSLTALLSVLPNIHLKKYIHGGITKYYATLIRIRQFNSEYYDNPVDVCYEMVLKLHELKML
jgi:hypothetical protein